MAVRAVGTDITDDAFVRCRTYNHAWDEFYPVGMETPWYGWRLSLRCIRCSTERHDNYDFKGLLMGRRYLYPDGYRTKGEDRPTKEVFREELFLKLRSELASHSALGREPEKVVAIKKTVKTRQKAS